MLSLNSKIAYKEVDGQIVLINLDSGFYYSLNETAAVIFQMIQDKKEVGEIARELCASYDLTEETAENDIKECVDSLLKEQILVESG